MTELVRALTHRWPALWVLFGFLYPQGWDGSSRERLQLQCSESGASMTDWQPAAHDPHLHAEGMAELLMSNSASSLWWLS